MSRPCREADKSLDQRHRMGGNAEALAGEAKVLLRRGLDADGVHGQTKGVGNVPAHGRDMRGQLRALAEDRGVDVADLIAVLGNDAGDLAGQGQRVRALVGGGRYPGKCWPMSPSAAAPSTASITACSSTSASEWPSRPFSYGISTPPIMSLRSSTKR